MSNQSDSARAAAKRRLLARLDAKIAQLEQPGDRYLRGVAGRLTSEEEITLPPESLEAAADLRRWLSDDRVHELSSPKPVTPKLAQFLRLLGEGHARIAAPHAKTGEKTLQSAVMIAALFATDENYFEKPELDASWKMTAQSSEGSVKVEIASGEMANEGARLLFHSGNGSWRQVATLERTEPDCGLVVASLEISREEITEHFSQDPRLFVHPLALSDG